jgi:hypothetical protein
MSFLLAQANTYRIADLLRGESVRIQVQTMMAGNLSLKTRPQAASTDADSFDYETFVNASFFCRQARKFSRTPPNARKY